VTVFSQSDVMHNTTRHKRKKLKIMKNIFLFVILALISCNDDDRKSQETNILGTWKLISLVNESNGSLLVKTTFSKFTLITVMLR